jgi:hypothetical protein
VFSEQAFTVAGKKETADPPTIAFATALARTLPPDGNARALSLDLIEGFRFPTSRRRFVTFDVRSPIATTSPGASA